MRKIHTRGQDHPGHKLPACVEEHKVSWSELILLDRFWTKLSASSSCSGVLFWQKNQFAVW